MGETTMISPELRRRVSVFSCIAVFNRTGLHPVNSDQALCACILLKSELVLHVTFCISKCDSITKCVYDERGHKAPYDKKHTDPPHSAFLKQGDPPYHLGPKQGDPPPGQRN